MYSQLYSQLALNNSGPTTEYSQPVPMQGYNTALPEMVVFVQTATNVVVQVQESNDMQNWKDKGSSTITATVAGYFTPTSATTGIAAAYIRLKVTLTGTGTAIVAIGVTVSAQ